jgi:hypothetical protein
MNIGRGLRYIYMFKLLLVLSDLKKLKNIAISDKNYQTLRELGHTSDSFNDVITVILKKALQTGDSWRDPQSAKTQLAHGDDNSPG